MKQIFLKICFILIFSSLFVSCLKSSDRDENSCLNSLNCESGFTCVNNICIKKSETNNGDNNDKGNNGKGNNGNDGNDGNDGKGTQLENGLTGIYFADKELNNKIFERIDPNINFDWLENSPGQNIPPDSFGIRWLGSIKPQFNETYTITTASDDGIKVWIDNELIIDNWTNHSLQENQASIELKADKLHFIKIEYYDNMREATAKLFWASTSRPKEIIPKSRLFTKYEEIDKCPNNPNKTHPGKCGCDKEENSCGGELKIIVFSVGSGDSSLIIFPTGKIMMVDTGTEAKCKERVIPFLKRHNINYIDYYVETHPHGDHVGGRSTLTSQGFIDEKTVKWDWNTHKYEDQFTIEDTHWFIYNSRDKNFHGTDTNNNSLSYRIEYNGFIYSAAGDEGTKSQNRFLKDHQNLVQAHVRNTAHHMWGPVVRSFLIHTNPCLFIISSSLDVKEDNAFKNTFMSAYNELKNSSDRLREYALTAEKGNIIVRASNSETWDYEFCSKINTCVVPNIP